MTIKFAKHIALAIGSITAIPVIAAPEQANAAGSHVDFYFSNLDYEIESAGIDDSVDGSGYGMDFWLGNGIGLFTAEMQRNNLDGNVQGIAVDVDSRSLRAGLGYRFVNTPTLGAWLRGEYVQFDTDIDVQSQASADDTQDGYAIHFGGMLGQGMLRGYAELGYVDLSDLDGIEYTVGINIQPGTVGGFVEFRGSELEADDFQIDETFSDVRLGFRVVF